MNKNKVHGQRTIQDAQKRATALDEALKQAQQKPQSQIKNTNPAQPAAADTNLQTAVNAVQNEREQTTQETQNTPVQNTPVQEPTVQTESPQTAQNQQNSNTGVSYDANADYTALINAAVANGNYQQAAIYEQQRNAKIAAENLAYEQTNQYAEYLPGGEKYGTVQSSYNDLSPLINQMYDQEAKRLQTELNYEVQGAVDQLNRALQDAQPTYEAAIANQLLETRQAQDAQALRNQVNGDRGGIGSAQVSSIGNTGARNREAIAQEQRKLATDTARQIADLRARGKYQEANLLLQNSQQRLAALYEEQVRQQQQKESQNELLSSIGLQFLQSGQMPPDNVLAAMGLDRDTAQRYANLFNAQRGGYTDAGSHSDQRMTGFVQYSDISELGTAAKDLLGSFDAVDSVYNVNGNLEKVSNAYLSGSITLSEAVYILSAIGIGDGTSDFAYKFLQSLGD